MNTPFEDLERLRSDCSLMDKAARVAYLRGQLQQLNNLANQKQIGKRGLAGDCKDDAKITQGDYRQDKP